MTFKPLRALVFFVIGLPVGFIAAAFAFAVMQAGLSAAAILPWALAIAVAAGLLGGFWKDAL
ncbi:MAG: hypothetical protein RKE49_08355 [Oceanicaulis sp.]